VRQRVRVADAVIDRVACVTCGRHDANPLYTVNGFTIAKCACGLVRTMLPPDFDLASIYTEAYFQGGQRDGYADYLASGAELRHEFRRIVASIRERVPSGKLVELGCAFGFFLEEAAPSFETCGVEISDHARAVCASRGLDVEREATPEFLASRGPFDVAVMLDVLEHMRDPASVLDRLHVSMRPGAQLVVTTGDYGSMLSRAMGKRWRLMTPPQHLWFFSPETVTRLLARHGFRVHTVEHPWKLVPLALVAYQAARYLGTGQELVRKYVSRGRLPINLFDAMRVIATRDERVSLAEYRLASGHARGRVLDLACGDGTGTALVHAQPDVTSVVGVDGSSETIRLAADRYAAPNLSFRSVDPLAFHDKDGFDTVISIDTLDHVRDPELLLVRLVAALRRDGALIASSPTSLRPRFERYGLAVATELAVTRDRATCVWRRA
jgi:2-polyprenyl-3-methyl-5-hydroxy-6-metoxy-1,4-benzoquinol methylase